MAFLTPTGHAAQVQNLAKLAEAIVMVIHIVKEVSSVVRITVLEITLLLEVTGYPGLTVALVS